MKVVIIEEIRGSKEKGPKKFHAFVHKNTPKMEAWSSTVHGVLIKLGEKMQDFYDDN